MNWYQIENQNDIDSPALLIYPDRVQNNIEAMLKAVGGDAKRLVPHVKTHKMSEIVQMQLTAGIERFKCATIAELEMCLAEGAKWVLMSYQLVGPKINRFITLSDQFPAAKIFSLVDNLASAKILSDAFEKHGKIANVFLDVNNGQDRTGFPVNDGILEVYQRISLLQGVSLIGLHVYDGHIRAATFEDRKAKSDEAFLPIYVLLSQLESAGLPAPEVISGGSPSFSSAALRPKVFCSPGTTLLWDWGYAQLVPEADLQWAALLMTRVISKPNVGLVTTDLGHKSVAAENPIDKRVFFLNLADYEPISQSEEHLVLRVADWESIQVGDVLYGVPYHVCPSVALHDVAHIVRENKYTDNWNIVARRRKINF